MVCVCGVCCVFVVCAGLVSLYGGGGGGALQ